MALASFDTSAFYSSLDKTRESRKLTWKQVAKEARISASTLTRLAQGRRPDVDTLAALCAWSGLSVDEFVRRPGGPPVEPDPVARISAYLRADAQLSPKTAEAIERVLRATYDLVKNEGAE